VPSLHAAFVAPGSQESVYCLFILAFPAWTHVSDFLTFVCQLVYIPIKLFIHSFIHFPPLQFGAAFSSIAYSVAPPEPLSATGLASCVTQRTAAIFHIFCVNGKTNAESFLAKHPTEWSDDPSYQELHRPWQR